MRLSKKISITLLLLIIVVFFTVQAFGQEGLSAEQKEIWERVQTVWELWKKGDREAVNARIHENFIYWSNYRSVPDGRDSFVSSLFSFKIKSYELKPIEIRISGNVAIVQYLWKFTNVIDEVYTGRSMGVGIKQDEKWRILGAMSASCTNLPPCPFSIHNRHEKE